MFNHFAFLGTSEMEDALTHSEISESLNRIDMPEVSILSEWQNRDSIVEWIKINNRFSAERVVKESAEVEYF